MIAAAQQQQQQEVKCDERCRARPARSSLKRNADQARQQAAGANQLGQNAGADDATCPNGDSPDQQLQQDADSTGSCNGAGSKKSRTTLKSLLAAFAGQHLNLFHTKRATAAAAPATALDEQLVSPASIADSQQDKSGNCEPAKGDGANNANNNANLFLAFAQKYLNLNFGSDAHQRLSQSCPATPIKQPAAAMANGLQAAHTGRLESRAGDKEAAPARPSVRFSERPGGGGDHDDGGASRFMARAARAAPLEATFAECGVQTCQKSISWASEPDAQHSSSPLLAGAFVEDDQERARLVGRLFEASGAGSGARGPMDSAGFRENAYKLVDYICHYLDTIRERRVTPINIEPGYLKALIEPAPPELAEPFARIMHDFEAKIMCGITHWQHPHFHAYFPAGNAFPSILADMLGDALGCVGFSWAASPAYTELEIIMLDWMGKMIGLPDEFLCLAGSKTASQSAPPGTTASEGGGGGSRGGGVIQGSASECVLVNLLAARHWAMEKLRKKYPGTPDGLLLSKLIGYCSKEAHSCVEKAAMIGFIRMRALDTDHRHSLRGPTLAAAIEADLRAGLEPFIVCATLGTTSCVSFDNLRELGQVCQAHDQLWLHVDAAYAGSALICPEFKYLIDGIELATSFNMNPNKWLLINFDCSLMWVKDRFKLTRAFVVDPLYLQHSFSDQAIDYRHWGIPLSRRFRALKLWFVIRSYGVEGLRSYIRNHVRLAKLFAGLLERDTRFQITNEVTLGLVCFRLVGSNALNQRLLSMLNASGKLHMVPASLEGRYIIRFCVCDQNAQERDIHYAYECIAKMASELFELIKAGKERIRAISQQNTIDVSSVSLHTQQSASAGPLSGAEQPAELGAEQQVEAAAAPVAAATPERLGAAPARSPLVKQSSKHQEELECAIESLATINGCDYDLDLDSANSLDDEDEDELAGDEETARDGELAAGEAALQQRARASSGEQLQASAVAPRLSDSMSPIERGRLSRSSAKSSRSYLRTSTAGAGANANDEDDEAADELVKLIDKRNRMSLRYKREFFVRVVSDPRVYRASISGDINAHASTNSLGAQAEGADCGGAGGKSPADGVN